MAKPMNVLSNVFNELEISVNLQYKAMHGASNVLTYMKKRQCNRRITETHASLKAEMRILMDEQVAM